jgi:hypothetical protein
MQKHLRSWDIQLSLEPLNKPSQVANLSFRKGMVIPISNQTDAN